jgi:hypothetical protein
MANKKITELTEETSPAGADLLPLVDDVAGTPTTKKVTITNLMTLAPVQTADISGFATTVSLGNHESLTSSVHGISAFGATLVDDVDAAAARTTLGLGTAATKDTGTSANNVVQLDGTAKLPAVDGSLLTNLPSSVSKSLVTPTFTGTPLAYTLTSSENGKVVVVNESSTAYITVPQSLGSGFNCTIVQKGSGRVVLQAGTGANVVGYDFGVATIGQYGVIDLVPIATDSYYVTGDTDRAPFLNTYSADFDGTNDHLHFGTSATNKNINLGTSYAVSLWFRSGASSGVDMIFRDTVANQWLYKDGSGLNLKGFTGSTETFSNVVSTNTWYHFVVTRVSSGSVDVYLNGSALTTTGGTPPTNPGLASFGYHISGYFWLGQMDEISFHIGSGLTSSQVSAMYNSGAPIDISSGYGATHWWRMGDSFSGTTIADQIGSEPLYAANGVDLQSTTVPI